MRTRLIAFILAVAGGASIDTLVRAQGGGQNINIVTGSADQFTGDVFRQRQGEPVIGISSVNPSHMLAAYVDYRTVDCQVPGSCEDTGAAVPGSAAPAHTLLAKVFEFLRAPWKLGRESEAEREAEGEGENEAAEKAASQAFIGLSMTDNGGKSWYTGLHPGKYTPTGKFPTDTDPSLPDAPALAGFDAASDPVMGTTQNQFFLGGIAFNANGNSIGFFSRFTDRNNSETGRNIHFDGSKVLLSTGSAAAFVDKPSIGVGPGGKVYMAFVVFDQSDPKKINSKILFFVCSNFGATCPTQGTGLVISDPQSRNQAPWILVNPNNENIVYVGWRVFSNKPGGASNAIVGRVSTNGGVSFAPSTPYIVASKLKAFDQPQGSLPNSLPIPRSNAYPTAAIDGNGTLHAAMQEYVNPATGLPLGPNDSVTKGVPRITVMSSYDGGANWTQRKAIDLGTTTTPAGTQFMPVLTAVGEPGPPCAGSAGPRSRVMLMYYDARAGGVGRVAGGTGYVEGGDKQFDVRVAWASACSNNGLAFNPSAQLSQYTRNSTAPFDIATTPGPGNSQVSRVNRAYSMFCGGNCAFSGDYNHVTPRVPYVQTPSGWRLTTSSSVDKDKLPAPVVQAVWADTRDALLPLSGAPRPVPAPSPIDALRWDIYQAPSAGLAACINPGSRDQNVYTTEFAPGGLFASAPVTFRTSNIPRGYPLYVENRTPSTRYYRLTIDSMANASFDYTDFDPNTPNFGGTLAQVSAIKIGPISSVTGTIIVGPQVSTPIPVTVEETDSFGAVIAPPTGAKTTVTLYTLGGDVSAAETLVPAIAPTPIITKPFDGLTPFSVTNTSTVGSPTPFSPNPFSPNPFSPNPFSPNPFSPNPFSPNPFSPNPFSPNSVVQDVTDISYVITNEGDQTAAFNALANVANATGTHVFQLLINRAVPTPTFNFDQALANCRSIDTTQAVPISTIANPFSPNPFSPNPFSPNPFSPNPFSPNPFSPNPFPSEFSNATFYVAPATESLPSFLAARPVDKTVVTIRDFLMSQVNGQPVPPGTPVTANNVVVAVVGQEPPHNGTSYVGPVPSTAIPHHLAFTVQPVTIFSGQSIPTIKVEVRDGFDKVITTPSLPVTLTIGTNPSGGTLFGTTTRNTVNGVATFSGLAIDNPGAGYTLVASASGVAPTTSSPFNVTANPTDPTGFQLPVCGDEGDGTATLQCADYTPLPNVQTFVVPGSGPTNLTFDWIYRGGAAYQNELVAYRVDDAIGSVNGLHPGDAGYLAAAFGRASVIFPSGSTPATADRTLSFQGGDRLAFFIVQDGTLNDLKTSNPNNSGSGVPGPRIAFFSISSLNPDGVDHMVAFNSGTLGLTEFAFEDLTGGSSSNDVGYFLDVVFTVAVTPYQLFGSVTDPSGDVASGNPDLVSGSVGITGNDITLSVRLAPGTSTASTGIQFLLDTDENPSTGSPGSDSLCMNDAGLIGIDYLVEMGPGSTASVLYGGNGTQAGIHVANNACNSYGPATLTASGSVVYETDGMRVTFPRSLIGGDDGKLHFKVITYRNLGGNSFTGVLDRMTDVGQPAAISGVRLDSNTSAFVAATSATSATGPLPDLGGPFTTSRTVGSVMFSVAAGGNNFSIGAMETGADPDWYGPLSGNDIALGYENLQVDFAAAVKAMGFFFVEPNATMPAYGGIPVDSVFQVTLYNGATPVGTFTFNAPDDQVVFVSIQSGVPFTRAVIVDTTGNGDDEYFGQFYTAP